MGDIADDISALMQRHPGVSRDVKILLLRASIRALQDKEKSRKVLKKHSKPLEVKDVEQFLN